MQYFFDPHCHVMTLKHPNVVSFINSIDSSLPDFIKSGALSPSYILTGRNLNVNNMFSSLMNTLRAFDGPIDRIFRLMEDDLAGVFTNRTPSLPYPDKPFFRDGMFHFRDMEFDRIALCPLLMDFSILKSESQKMYYAQEVEDKITTYAQDTIEGIETYYQDRPNHLFDIFPLLGINPKAHTEKEIQHLLDEYVVTDHRIVRERHTQKRFYGIKFYPPLGFDAWPKDKTELRKVRLLYDFCTAYDLPIITHCDDQGFRTYRTTQAWNWTNPNHFIPALEVYPELRIDFAHFGTQYSAKSHNTLNSLAATVAGQPNSPWFYQIIDLMKIYPHVMSDFSFSGTSPAFYTEVLNYLGSQSEEARESLKDRMMFGSDFSINLLKVESYSEYYEIFAESGFSDADILRFAQTNPMSFLGLKEAD